MFRAAIFDLDGVVTDTATLHFRAWRSMAADIGIGIDESFNELLKGVGRMDSLDRILEFGGCAGDYGEDDRVRLADAKNADYVESLSSLGPRDVLPGIRGLIEEMRRREIRVGLASASKNAPRILDALGMRAHFDRIADPSAVPHGKPAPDLFLEAARVLGVEPHDCIGIEDAIAGIESINAAGMVSVGVGDVKLMASHGAHVFFPSTESMTFADLVDRCCEAANSIRSAN